MASLKEVRVPDIGDFEDVDVVEVLVSPGQTVQAEESLITLESDKASMEVPSPVAGVVQKIGVAVGDKVSEGALIVTLEVASSQAKADGQEERPQTGAEAEAATPQPSQPSAGTEASPAPEAASGSEPGPEGAQLSPAVTAAEGREPATSKPHASPSVRLLARELGVDLTQVSGSGAKGRILRKDIEAYVKATLSSGAGTPSGALPEMPAVDFSKFGPVEEKPLSRIRRLAAKNLHRSWLHVPLVTQFDEADITDLESFRKSQREAAEKRGLRLTPVAFLMKACVAGLREFPDFNSSLHPSGEKLIHKKYFHIAVAVDTADGLVVPVIRDVDQKSLFTLAAELAEVSGRARQKKLTPRDLQGGCFTISSLGGIGGTAFTPIVNAPEVAILGVSRSVWKPVYRDGELEARLVLPLSLSYDHRVIDGATAVRFTGFLAGVLSDIRRLLL